MSTMMTPQAHIAALKALHVAVGIESNKLAGAPLPRFCVDPYIALSSSREHLRNFVILYNDTCWFADLQPEVFCHIAYNHYEHQ